MPVIAGREALECVSNIRARKKGTGASEEELKAKKLEEAAVFGLGQGVLYDSSPIKECACKRRSGDVWS